MNLDLYIIIRSTPPDHCYRFVDDSKIGWETTDLKEIGRFSKKYNILIGYIRYNYYMMTESTNDRVVDYVNVLKSIELCPPKWIKKLFN